MAPLVFSRALGALRVIRPALGGSLGTGGLGVAPAGFSGLGAGAGGALVAVVRELLSSRSVGLPAVLLPGAGGP